MPAGHNPGQSKSLGLRIVQSLAEQIGGRVTYEVRQGTTARIEFDAAG
jgi:two-component sensor histidine kinase